MRAYFRLMRFHKPVGIWLLWFPTAWALWIANQGNPPIKLVFLFLLGTVIMRAAGCVINDIADRHVDMHVLRTRERPLVKGEIGLIQAFSLLAILLVFALAVLIQLPSQCFYYAIFALIITVLYPFCKRYIQGPQLILGLAFSMGIPMAFCASNHLSYIEMLALFLINFFWILAYDTEYAMVDREDDLKIGVKSTAILFAAYDRVAICFFQFCFHMIWLFLALELEFSRAFFVVWSLAILQLLFQQKCLAKREREGYLYAFSSNSWYGLIMWIGLMLA
ncbi:MAG: 4-hydroxybenzoate octaprenyltransferase [Tatlockia sp.]|nr:4-hydroxybenzoate octaprenyltransferase [Tatlockia sp.]